MPTYTFDPVAQQAKQTAADNLKAAFLTAVNASQATYNTNVGNGADPAAELIAHKKRVQALRIQLDADIAAALA